MTLTTKHGGMTGARRHRHRSGDSLRHPGEAWYGVSAYKTYDAAKAKL